MLCCSLVTTPVQTCHAHLLPCTICIEYMHQCVCCTSLFYLCHRIGYCQFVGWSWCRPIWELMIQKLWLLLPWGIWAVSLSINNGLRWLFFGKGTTIADFYNPESMYDLPQRTVVLRCFHLWLYKRGLGEFPWRHQTDGLFAVVACWAWRPIFLLPITGRWEPCDAFCPPGGQDGMNWNRVWRSSSKPALGHMTPGESLGWFRP